MKQAGTSQNKLVKPNCEEIAKYAYYLWEKEGKVHGRDVEYWLQAEAQLLAVSKPNGNSKKSGLSLDLPRTKAAPKARNQAQPQFA